ncbi:MAG: DUF4115 domain-containing protein [Undibacterium sp.]|nr:DUF4115 domain-containing protein [Undibacterium sp.]
MNSVSPHNKNDMEQVASESASTLSPFSVGEQLSNARNQKKWSVQYVAEQLKLSQSQVVALEANQYAALPKMVIVRGFVRAYAKLLKIDSDAMILSLPVEVSPFPLDASMRPALSTPFIESRSSLLGQNDTNKRYIVGAVCLVAVVGIFLVLQHTELGQRVFSWFGKSNTAAVTSPVSDVVETQLSTNLDASKPNVIAPSPQSTTMVTSLPVVQNQAVPASQANEDATAATSVPLAQPASLAVDAAEAVKQEQKQEQTTSALPLSESFTLKFRQNSWIQVKTLNGVILSSHLAKAGTEESFSLKQNLQIKIGNAAGVDGVLRGVAMPITAEKGSNVANFLVK